LNIVPIQRATARRFAALLSTALLLAAPATPVEAQIHLPALGESASSDFDLSSEKRLGDQVMRDIRRDPDYLDDPQLIEYLATIWQPLIAAARERGDIGPDTANLFAWESFLVRDRSVNAFALPGGFVGVNLGLIAMTASRDELASVLGHELSHVTQRHIARSMAASQRNSTLGMAAMLLGILAASRSANADLAQAAIMGGQGAMAQAQLNFSRDMEREADRNGYALLTLAGFSPWGMSQMFEKLDGANRVNDSGGYPYLRSHPLTTERIGDARQRAMSTVSAPTSTGSAMWHAAMSARARVLMDPGVVAWQRLQQLDPDRLVLSAAERVAAGYASSLASLMLRDYDRADATLIKTRVALQGNPDAAVVRAIDLLATQIALSAGKLVEADRRAHSFSADGSRSAMLMRAGIAIASVDHNALVQSTEALQTWVTGHSRDSQSWATLAQAADLLGLRLRAVRADAEAHAAIGDLPGAIDRLQAGQRASRIDAVGVDFIEASVIDARLRNLRSEQRSLLADSRANRRRSVDAGTDDEEH
jgi:predicted Zn-dependent protease